MRTAIIVAAALSVAACGSDKDYVRQELVESARYIDKSCGKDQECRQALQRAELMRIEADLHRRQAAREAFAEGMRQHSENQARIAAARAAQPIQPVPVIQPPRTVQTNCWRTGNNLSCQSY